MSNGNEHETGTIAQEQPQAAIDFVGSRFDRVEILAANIRRDLEEARLLLIEARQALQRGAQPPADPPA